jgi:hypothetical protein
MSVSGRGASGIASADDAKAKADATAINLSMGFDRDILAFLETQRLQLDQERFVIGDQVGHVSWCRECQCARPCPPAARSPRAGRPPLRHQVSLRIFVARLTLGHPARTIC